LEASRRPPLPRSNGLLRMRDLLFGSSLALKYLFSPQSISSSPNRVTPDVIELVLAQRAESGWGARRLSVILGQAGVRISPTTVNTILKEHGRIASEDPNAACWIRQVLVEDDPLSRITTDVPNASTPAGFASGYDTAVCTTGRRQWQSWRDSKGYDSIQSPRVLT
jgi:hypothetical protein